MTSNFNFLDVTADKVSELHETIREQIFATRNQTKAMFWLSLMMLVLTVTQVVLLVYQIWFLK